MLLLALCILGPLMRKLQCVCAYQKWVIYLLVLSSGSVDVLTSCPMSSDAVHRQMQ